MKNIPLDFGLEAVAEWTSLRIKDYVAKWEQAKTIIESAGITLPKAEIVGKGNAVQNEKGIWELNEGDSIEVKLPKGATMLYYCLNGEDPKGSEQAKRIQGSLTVKEQLKEKSKLEIYIRTGDNEGNWGDLTTLNIVNKTKQYNISVEKDKLFGKMATFIFPEDLMGFIAAMKSLIRNGVKQKIITEEQANKLEEIIENI